MAEVQTLSRREVYKIIKFIGLILLIGGVAIGYMICLDYTQRDREQLSFFFEKDDKLSDLATALLGTTGLLWSLAGTIFFIFTIYQTKDEIRLQIKEMRQTNKSLVKQHDQTTFFNLIDNQNRLLEVLRFNGENGLEALRKYATKIREDLLKYTIRMRKKEFENSAETQFHPYNAILSSRQTVRSYLENIETIVKFIDDNFENKKLFNEILYNRLSIAEKFLLGIFYYYSKDLPVSFLNPQNNNGLLKFYEETFSKYKNPIELYFAVSPF